MSIVANRPIDEVRGSAERLWRWWLGELSAAWADASRWWHERRGNLVTIEAGERQWLLRRGNRVLSAIECSPEPAGLRELVGLMGRRAAIMVEIPPEGVLSKTIPLPAEAENRLDHILGFEIARHFPFAAERVFYGHRVVGRTASGAPAPATVSVEIAAVPRDIVFGISDALRAAGLTAANFALVPAADAKPLLLAADPLLPVAQPRHLPRAMLLALGGLALAAVISWPVAQQVRLAAIDRDIAEVKPAAEAALQQRTQRQRASDQEAAIAALRNARPPLVGVLNELTRAVPDGSWLLSLSVKGRDLVLDGLAPSAAAIALALQHDPAFTDISFRAPISRDPATGLEHFQLGASLTEAGR